MKLKDKTTLRKTILNSIGNTGQLRNIWVFDDGTWEIYDRNTSPLLQCFDGISIYSMLEFTEYYGPNDWKRNAEQTQKAISAFFAAADQSL